MTITCTYTATPVGTQTLSAVASAMAAAAIPLDQGLLEMTGLTVASDGTTAGSSTVVRTIVLNKTAAFLQQFPTASTQANAVKGWMTKILSLALRSPILESAPVIT